MNSLKPVRAPARTLVERLFRPVAIKLPVLTVAVCTTSAAEAKPAAPAPPAAKAGSKPNIVVIMADDVGILNIGAYHRGMMAGKTSNLDKIAAEGMLFTDYYAEASCTAGRANFIKGQLPIRTGMTTVGQAGSPIGMPSKAPTLAAVLKLMGYATGQFGKNHMGDLNEFLPTLHGFDKIYRYLYHLDAMEGPAHPGYPRELLKVVGPWHTVHSRATNVDDPTVMPRWGKVGKQKVEDAGQLLAKRRETVDDEIQALLFEFIDKAKADGKPFFLWLNPARMHIVTHLSDKYEKKRNSQKAATSAEPQCSAATGPAGTTSPTSGDTNHHKSVEQTNGAGEQTHPPETHA